MKVQRTPIDHRPAGTAVRSAARERRNRPFTAARPERTVSPQLRALLIVLIGLLLASGARADWVTLKSIDFGIAEGGNLRFEMTFDGPITQPRMFQTDRPPRIAIDFPGVRNGLAQKNIPVKLRGAESIQVVEAGGRTRAVLNLAGMVPYSGSIKGNRFVLIAQTGASAPIGASSGIPRPIPVGSGRPARPAVQPVDIPTARRGPPAPLASGGAIAPRVETIDFRRGENGEGRVIVSLTDARSVVDVRTEGQRIVVQLPGVALGPRVARKYDVLDFGTPVRTIEAQTDERAGSRLVITPTSQAYDYSSYQSEGLLTVELRPLTRAELEQARQDKALKYSGERLSLNFQDIPVRSVLQILADFTNVNIVASDSVQGNLTLRLNEVPWDQALDVVMQLKGLAKRQDGNIIRVGPVDEISDFEERQLKARKQVEALEPLKTELIQINYAKASDILQVLVGKYSASAESQEQVSSGGTMAGGATEYSTATAEQVQSKAGTDEAILTRRGSATIDPRSNILIVKDIARSIERVRELVRQLDKPVRQVLIESRIVIAQNTFLRELGAKLGLNRQIPGMPQTAQGYLVPTEGVLPVNATQGATYGDALVDLGAAAAAASGGSVGFTLLKAGDYLLDLELSAAQRNGRSETLSNPRVITADSSKATIKQGVQIPIQITQQGTGGGIPVQNVTFKDAVLELNVTPHITPDDNILMDLLIKKDQPGQRAPNGNQEIDTREVQTTAKVANGETIVLGGVYEDETINNIDKVPFFGDLPGIGFFFRRDLVDNKKKELLFFITPKMLDQTLGSR